MTLPIIGITMGDPSGIGPEIIIGSYSHDTSFLNCSLLVIGNSKRLIETSKILKKDIKINECKSTDDIINKNNVINCMTIGELPTNMTYGSNSITSGKSAYKYIETAVTLALNNKINAICILDNGESLNISQLSSLIINSSFVVANDTGPAHIAAHLNVKGITLFGQHTTATKVSIETDNFKAIQVSDLSKLSANSVMEKILI